MDSTRRVTIALGFVLLFLLSGASVPLVTGASSAPPYKAQGFDVLNAVWGTSANTEAGPGDIGVPLTVTLQYVYPFYVAVATEAVLNLTGTGFTGSDGRTNQTAWNYGSLSPGQIFQLTYYLDLGTNLQLGFHSIPITLFWTALLSNETGIPETYLYQETSVIVRVTGTVHLSYKASPIMLVPGEINDVTVTVTNAGTVAASDITTTISSPQGIGLQSQFPVIASLQPGSSYNETVGIYAANSTAGESEQLTFTVSYVDAYGIAGSVNQDVGFIMRPLTSASMSLYVTPISDSVVSGGSSEVAFLIKNIGDSTIYSPTFTLSVPAPLVIEDNSTVFEVGTEIAPGATQVYTATLTASPGGTSGAYQASIGVTYKDEYGTTHSGSYSLAIRLNESAGASLSVSAISDAVVSGTSSEVSFLVTNTGDSTIYSPTFTLSVASPLVIEANSTFSETGTEIAPGASQVFTATLTASPGATSGIYQATLQVAYTNQFGTGYTGSYEVAIRLSGLIVLLVQDLSTSQNATGVTVTGNILDEGSSAAYYSSVTGYLNTSKAPGTTDYIGEVDVNSPTPFSISIPYQPGSHESVGNLTLLIDYKDSLGQPASTPTSSGVLLLSLSDLQPLPSSNITPSNGSGLFALSITELIIVMVVVFAVVGVVVVAVARRRGRAAKAEAGPEEAASQVA